MSIFALALIVPAMFAASVEVGSAGFPSNMPFCAD
jgi:hypothetical protein